MTVDRRKLAHLSVFSVWGTHAKATDPVCGARNFSVIESFLFLVKSTFSGISRCPVSVGNW